MTSSSGQKCYHLMTDISRIVARANWRNIAIAVIDDEPFFDTKPKCGSNCGQNLRPTRINTGVSADFRLQPQKPRFCTWVTGDLPEFSRILERGFGFSLSGSVKSARRTSSGASLQVAVG